jgi:hypothetical protein
MGTARQVIAIAITVLAGQSLLEGYQRRFVALVLLAGCFHLTAIIFLFAWYLVRPAPKLSTSIMIIVMCFGAGQIGQIFLPLLLDLISGVAGLGEKIIFYANLGSENLDHASADILNTLWYVKRIAFLCFFLIFQAHFNTKALSFYFNAYMLSVILFLIINPTFPILATRGANYFSIYELFLLAFLTTVRTKIFILFVPLFVLLSGQRLYTSLYSYHPDLFIPYKGLFINDEGR